MSNVPEWADSPAKVYAYFLLELHERIAEGEGESDEADRLRDEMDDSWNELSPEEAERMRLLSEDLYVITEGRMPPASMTEDQRQEYARQVEDNFNRDLRREADQVLAFLRSSAPKEVPGDVIPYLQATVWKELGFPHVALRFMREAEQKDPRHRVQTMSLLQSIGRGDEAYAYARQILNLDGLVPSGS